MTEMKSNIRFSPVSDPVYVHALTTSIRYGDNEIGEIAIRKPTSRDLLHIGTPIAADPTSGKDASLNLAVAFKMASALSGLPEKILEQADPADLIDLFWKLGSFFIPGWQGLLPAMMTLKDLSSSPDARPASSPASITAPVSST